MGCRPGEQEAVLRLEADAQILAGLRQSGAGGGAHRGGHLLTGAHAQRDMGDAALIGDIDRLALEADGRAIGAQLERLGAHEQQRLLALAEADRVAAAQGAERGVDARHAVGGGGDAAADRVVLADEGGDERRARLGIDGAPAADLLDHAGIHHRDAVRHGERFALVVGDVDEGDADPLLDGAQLGAHVLAQLEVERGERLVEQQHGGLDRQRPGDGDALLLAAGELAHLLGAVLGERHLDQQVLHLLVALVARHAAYPQAVADIVGHAHHREQSEVLEDQRGRPLVGADALHVRAADPHRAAGRLDEAGNGAQQRGLAAAGRAEEGEELARFDGEVGVLHRDEVAEGDVDALKLDGSGHGVSLLRDARRHARACPGHPRSCVA